MNLEDYSRSLEISLECVDLYERVYSKEHPKYIQSLSLTGKVYHQLGNYDKSLEINLECLALINKTYVKGHRSYNIYLNTIIVDYLALGDYLNAYRLTSENQKNKYVVGKIPYRHIYKNGKTYDIKIYKNGKTIFRKSNFKWTLEDAIKVRNEAYIELGIEIDDATRNLQ